MTQRWTSFLGMIFIAVVLAFFAITPPSTKSIESSADSFSSGRAMQDVEIISAHPHPTGSAENAKVRAYLAQRLSTLGLSVTTRQGQLSETPLARLNRWSGLGASEQSFVNIIGVLPAKHPSANPKSKALLLMAHHDTVWGSPGAADDTIGIAAILEIIRALKPEEMKRDLIVLFTDAEELGLVGAKHFFSTHPLRDEIGAVINFEARGGGGTANLFQTSSGNKDAVTLYAKVVKQPSISSLSTFVYEVLPNDTDLTPALDKDYIAYNIANIGRAQYYHSPKITPQSLSEKTLQHMGSQGLDLTRALLSQDTLPARTHNATFFDVFGFFTIIYAPFWGWLILALALGLYGASLKTLSPIQLIATSALRMIGFLIIGSAALFGLNWLSGANGSADYYDRLAAITLLELSALLLCISLFFAIFTRVSPPIKNSECHYRLGLALPVFALGLAGQILAPTATYFISLSLLLGGIAAFNSSHFVNGMMAKASVILTSAFVLGYMIFLAHLLMLGVGADMLSVIILPAALAAMLIAPLTPQMMHKPRKMIILTSLMLSLAVALYIRFDPIASTVPVY